tara:strand:+ start:128 stop:655 length:528 start_codon:yes stop_codon:yes gene_type:complete
MPKKYKVRVLEFEQLSWEPESGFSIDRHHSNLVTFWFVEINKKKCIFFYADIKLYYGEYKQDQDCNIAIRPDPNFSKIWSNESEPDYNSEDRMQLQDQDEYLYIRPKLIENWYNNKEEKTETYQAHEDLESCSKEEREAYLLMYNQIKAIYEYLCPNSETKSTDDLISIEFDIKI